jgi:hypothetical protein
VVGRAGRPIRARDFGSWRIRRRTVIVGMSAEDLLPESGFQLQTSTIMKHSTPPATSAGAVVSNRSEGGLKPVPVRFEFKDPTALSVAVAGSFNDWDPKKHSLHLDGDGLWVREARLSPGQYEYCLVVDGHWMSDPAARDSRPNPFGGRNSVLIVPSTHNGGSVPSSHR